MTYQLVSLPRHVVSEILCNAVNSISFEEVQQLRLVNRLFNEEILFAIYVSLGQNEPRTHRLTEKSQRFVARRALQGHLTRLPHDQWTANIGEAVERLDALANSSGTGFALHLQKVHSYQYSSQSPSGSFFDNPVSGLVCDSLVAYYTPYKILMAIYDFNSRSQNFSRREYYQTYSPSFLVVLAACYSGDMIFLQEALNDERISAENIGFPNLVSSCLRVVSQQGHLHIMQFLLDAGFDVNHISINTSAIVIAAEGGNQRLLDLLLRPEFGLMRSGNQYTDALHAAADRHDTTTRLENVKTLYLAAEELEQPRTREALLFRACRRDDIALAKWLLADGPIDIYGAVLGVPLKTKSMLHWLGQQGKSEWLRWFLQVQPPRIFENDRHKRILASVLSTAAFRNHLEIFLETAKFFVHDPARLCHVGAFVEDGLPQLAARLPSLLLQSTLSQVCQNPDREVNVGPAALWRAISRGRGSNVQILLERGMRISRSVVVRRIDYENHRTSFSAIQTMLINHDNPVFIISDYQQPGSIIAYGARPEGRG